MLEIDNIKIGKFIKFKDKSRNYKAKVLESLLEDHSYRVLLSNGQKRKINKGLIYHIFQDHDYLINYKEDDQLEDYILPIGGRDIEISVHAQKRMIEKGIFSKDNLKERLFFISNELKEVKTKKNDRLRQKEFLSHRSNANYFYHRKENLVLVVSKKDILLTSYPFQGSKIQLYFGN
jgi:hypothetical protein